MLNMSEENSSQFLGEHMTAHGTIWQRRVNGVRGEEHLFFGDGLFHRDLILNVFLRAVFHTNITKSQRHFLVHNHALGISTAIHNIYLGDNTDSPDALFVQAAGHLETVRVSHVLIGGHYNENYRTAIRYISVTHVASDFFNIFGLVRAS